MGAALAFALSVCLGLCAAGEAAALPLPSTAAPQAQPAAPRPAGVAPLSPLASLPRGPGPAHLVPSLPEILDHALPGPWTLSLGLRGENPESNPAHFGLSSELRWWLEAGAWLGATAGWAGGVNDCNPDHLLIAQRIEAAATLGGRLPLTTELGVALAAKAGVMAVWGWPRGLLPDLNGELGPLLGAELIVDYRLSPTWSLAPRAGLSTVRILQSWLLLPGAGLDLVWRFGR